MAKQLNRCHLSYEQYCSRALLFDLILSFPISDIRKPRMVTREGQLILMEQRGKVIMHSPVTKWTSAS